MFIRQTKTGTASDGSRRISFRLVESRREGDKVRQITLLNLGRHFPIERQDWKALCQRIKETLSNQCPLLPLENANPAVEAEAQRIAAQLIERNKQGEENGPPSKQDFQTVDINSANDSDSRSVGVEHAGLEALSALGLPTLFDQLGFNRRQRCCALATIVARMAVPTSERATNAWLRQSSALGEMLDIDFGMLSDMALYRASDLLLAHQDSIEEHLFSRAQSLFAFRPTVTLFDLTNTFYEGQAASQPKAQRGHSKERRSDCPLLSLGLVLDASGFVRRSRVFAGNVTEHHTLAQMLDGLGAPQGAVVVMDGGIATEDNLHWLRANGYRYLVVSRHAKRVFDSDETQAITTASNDQVTVYKQQVTREVADGDDYEEAWLHCYSQARAEKESSIVTHFRTRLEDGLRKLHEGLSRPRTRKTLGDIQRRIGRLEKENARVARHYEITVVPGSDGTTASAVKWRFNPADTSMASCPGVYCLRSNILDWSATSMWQTYATLTDAESVFRSLKSELGLRPIYHHKPERADAHLLISVLAYQAVQMLRKRMRSAGFRDSWTTLRRMLETLRRTTTSFERRDGRTLHVRKTASASAEQLEIYRAMGLAPPPRNLSKTII